MDATDQTLAGGAPPQATVSRAGTGIQIPALPRFRRRPVDMADQQLKALEHQSAGLVQVAHTLAILMIVGTSVASLVTLSGAVVNHLVANITHSRNAQFTDIASVIISLLFVFVMDTASIYAATQVRVILERNLSKTWLWFHVPVMLLVSVLEGVTYAVMLWTYEPPHDGLHAMLIIGRAASVPLLSIYLVLARITPAGANDIVNLSSMAAGAGLLRDVYTASRDNTVSTARKAEIYKATQGGIDDQAKLDNLINVLHTPEGMAPGSKVTVADLVQKPELATTLQEFATELAARFTTQLATVEQGVTRAVAGMSTLTPADLDMKLQDWATQLMRQFTTQMDAMSEQFVPATDGASQTISVTNSAASQSDDNIPRQLPRPNSKAYKDLVKTTIGRFRAKEMRDPTLAEVATLIGDTEINIKPAYLAVIPLVPVEA